MIELIILNTIQVFSAPERKIFFSVTITKLEYTNKIENLFKICLSNFFPEKKGIKTNKNNKKRNKSKIFSTVIIIFITKTSK
jgi:hypothetical protein